LEKILKRPIKLLDITHGTIFNSEKCQSDRMVEYYKGDTWEAISNALRGPQAIWLIGHTEIIEACKQLINDTIDWQYLERIINKEKKSILSESLKVVDLAEQVFGANHAGSQLTNEINEWYPISGKVNKNIRQACVEHGHGGCWNVPDYHVNDVVYINIKECYPASMRGQGKYTPWFNRFGHPTHYLVQVAVNRKLPEDDITGFAQ
ncbi:15879_t:CDS:2, partial [Racocetra persica]